MSIPSPQDLSDTGASNAIRSASPGQPVAPKPDSDLPDSGLPDSEMPDSTMPDPPTPTRSVNPDQPAGDTQPETDPLHEPIEEDHADENDLDRFMPE